jgi:hypothetical protein
VRAIVSEAGSEPACHLLRPEQDVEDDRREGISQDDVIVDNLYHCIAHQHVPCKRYFLLRQQRDAHQYLEQTCCS